MKIFRILTFRGFSNKERFFLYITFFYIIVNIFPLFTDIMHIQTYVPALVVATLLGIFFFDKLFSKTIIWALIYILILFLYNVLGLNFHINGLSQELPGIYRIIIEAAWILPSLMIASILKSFNNVLLYKYIGYGSLFILIISFIYVFPMIQINSNYLRMDFEALDIVKPIGMPGYTLMHGYALLFPGLCYWLVTSKGKNKIIVFLIASLIAYIIIRTSITTSLFVLLFCIIFTVLCNPYKQTKSVLLFFIIGIMVLYIYYTGFLLKMIDGLMPFFDGTAVSDKLVDMHNSLIQGRITGSTITTRNNLHDISKVNFISNPIFGGGYAGSHSKILDILGSSGLLVFIPFIMIILNFVKEKANMHKNKYYKVFIYFSMFISFVYLYQKGIFGAEGWLFTFVITPTLIDSVYYSNNINK